MPADTITADAVTSTSMRLRRLAKRCRDLSEMTAIPDMTRELVSIATELEDEAERADRR